MAVGFPPLPDFERPPVVEVVLSLQFEPLTKLQVQHIGFLWSMFKDRFPNVETKPPLDPVMEMFEQRPTRPSVRFQVGEFPLFPRVWFVSSSGSELLQVQTDRFIHNWRKTGEQPDYPRYDRIREDFHRELETFVTFLADNTLGELKPNQCEITYINHIPVGDGLSSHGDANRILKPLRDNFRLPFLSAPEVTRFSTRYVMQRENEDNGKPFGRLYVDMNPAFDAQQKPLFVLNLTARAIPARQDIESAMSCYDIGRKHIVCTFDAITSESMHNVWGKHER